MHPLTVAVDVGPLHGHRTGIGHAVGHLMAALAARDDVATIPYLTSLRARPRPPQRRLPFPAAVATRAWAVSDVPRVDRWVRGADVLHGTNYVAPPSRLPTLVSVYDCWFLANPGDASPAVRRAGAILRRAVGRGAHVHASSHATAAAAGDLLATDRVHVVHLGAIPPPAVAPRRPAGVDDRPFVLALGTVERRKGLPALVRAFGRLAADDRDVRLVLAGAPGDDSHAVAAAVAGLPAAERARVHTLGAVDDAGKAWLLEHAGVLAYPSLDEGFGFPILEAQAARTPVVARAAGSIPEVGGDGVHLVDGTSDADLASALRRVLGDADLRAQLVAAGTENVTRFSWDATASGLVELYRLLVEEAR